MKDIAADLKLSRATVCYALGDSWQAKGLSRKTRDAVLKHCREIGYRRNRIAAGLTRRSTQSIAVVIPCISDMYAELLLGIENAVGEEYALLLGVSEYQAQREIKLLESFEERMVDGLIIVNAATPENVSILNRLRSAGMPIVQADRFYDGLAADVVEVNGEHATGLLTDHLLELGHRRIAFIPSCVDNADTRARRKGYETTMKRRELKTQIVEFHIEDPLNWKSPFIQEQIGAWMSRCTGAFPTAFVAHDDGIMTECVAALERRGLRCPEDVSACGVGREDAWEWKNPLLRFRPTRAVFSVPQMGRRAGEMMMQRLVMPRDRWPAPRRERLSGKLEVGGSTAPPVASSPPDHKQRLTRVSNRSS